MQTKIQTNEEIITICEKISNFVINNENINYFKIDKGPYFKLVEKDCYFTISSLLNKELDRIDIIRFFSNIDDFFINATVYIRSLLSSFEDIEKTQFRFRIIYKNEYESNLIMTYKDFIDKDNISSICNNSAFEIIAKQTE